MAYTANKKTWNLSTGSAYGILTYDYGTGDATLTPADSLYQPIELTVIDGSYVQLWAEAKRVIAGEILDSDPTAEQDLVDRIGYLDQTVKITFTNASPATVWEVSESVEPEHYQAIRALIMRYLNDLSNVV